MAESIIITIQDGAVQYIHASTADLNITIIDVLSPGHGTTHIDKYGGPDSVYTVEELADQVRDLEALGNEDI